MAPGKKHEETQRVKLDQIGHLMHYFGGKTKKNHAIVRIHIRLYQIHPLIGDAGHKETLKHCLSMILLMAEIMPPQPHPYIHLICT